MRSDNEIRERLAGINKAMMNDQGDLELLAMELEALKWALEGPKRYSFKTIKDIISRYTINRDTYINGFGAYGHDLTEYLRKKLGEPEDKIIIE